MKTFKVTERLVQKYEGLVEAESEDKAFEIFEKNIIFEKVKVKETRDYKCEEL